MNTRTRILLAEDQLIMRQGLRSLLEQEKDFEVVGEAANGHQAVSLVRQLKPHVVVMDIAMPELNGIEATRQVVAQAPACRVVALSMHADRQFVHEMLAAGAAGYLLKDCAFDELATAVRTVSSGKVYLSPAISGTIVSDYVRQARPHSPFHILSDRERQVLQLLAEGVSTKQVAGRLKISVKTAETHRRNLMQKLGIHSIAELTKYAVRHGLTDLHR